MSDTGTVSRNTDLATIAEQLRARRTRAVDLIAPASRISSAGGQLVVEGTDPVLTADGVTTTSDVYDMTDVALEGVSWKLGIPLKYLRRMRETRTAMFDQNVNGWLQGGRGPAHGEDLAAADPRRFMLRILQDENGDGGAVRAFLSDSYKPVDDLDMLLASLEGIRAADADVDISHCALTERRMHVRVRSNAVAALAPDLLKGYRSPFTGQSGDEIPQVFAGFQIGNSEVGCGRWTLTPLIVFKVCDNGMTIVRDAIGGVHVGAKHENDGIIKVSEDTRRKELELVTARTRDAVATFLDVEYVRAQLAAIAEQAGVQIEQPADVVRRVATVLKYDDAQADSILNMFIRGGQMTAGGIMQAVTAAAQVAPTADMQVEMEGHALQALAIAASR